MHNDDHLEELFEGQIEVTSLERGASFALDEEAYFRLASFAMTAAGVGIQPCTICRLTGGERGCKLTMFARSHQFDVVVRALRCGVTICVTAWPLDSSSLHCLVPVYAGWDCDAHWSRALRAMCEVESIGWFDQHWAAEQQQGED